MTTTKDKDNYRIRRYNDTYTIQVREIEKQRVKIGFLRWKTVEKETWTRCNTQGNGDVFIIGSIVHEFMPEFDTFEDAKEYFNNWFYPQVEYFPIPPR